MTNITKLHSCIQGDLAAREQWLSQQAVWYTMRHNGLRRRAKPFPAAADLHYPLADSVIERLKPFYFNQLFATATLATFVAREPELAPLARDAAWWFDWKLKGESNLEREILIAIDRMLMAGHDVVKIVWDFEENRMAFHAIDPAHCIVPEWTTDLDQADRVTLVHQLSVEQYRRDPRFRQEEELIRRICGRGTDAEGVPAALEEARSHREGITYAASDGQIVVWEVWERIGGGWVVHWLAPVAPGERLRASQHNPFHHGRLPLVRFDAEIKGKGHYEARGVPERARPFEVSLCKLWNEKHDFMAFCNRPLFSCDQPVPTAANLRWQPGDIIPFPIRRLDLGAPPVSFDQEMVQTRMVAEYNLGMPDFGQGQSINTKERRTATEVQNVSSLMNAGVELRGRTFRLALRDLLDLAWKTLMQFDKAGTRYFLHDEARDLDPRALRPDGFLIVPNGSDDSWNREATLQRAVTRKKLLSGSPHINQAELDWSIVELDDPRLLKRLKRQTPED